MNGLFVVGTLFLIGAIIYAAGYQQVSKRTFIASCLAASVFIVTGLASSAHADDVQLIPPLVIEAPAASMLPPEYLAAMEHADQRGIEVWDAIAECESGQKWNQHLPRHRYSGGLEFAESTWVMAGGQIYAAHPYEATRTEQIDIADKWLARTSWKQWPACSKKLGLRP